MRQMRRCIDGALAGWQLFASHGHRQLVRALAASEEAAREEAPAGCARRLGSRTSGIPYSGAASGTSCNSGNVSIISSMVSTGPSVPSLYSA